MTHSRLFLFRSSLFDRSRPVHNLAMRKSSHPHNAWPIKYLTGETLFPVNGHYVVLAQQEKNPGVEQRRSLVSSDRAYKEAAPDGEHCAVDQRRGTSGLERGSLRTASGCASWLFSGCLGFCWMRRIRGDSKTECFITQYGWVNNASLLLYAFCFLRSYRPYPIRHICRTPYLY